MKDWYFLDPDLPVGYRRLNDGRSGFQLAFMSLNDIQNGSAWNAELNPTEVINPHIVQQNVRDIFNQYNFMVVAERMDESLVALQC